MKSARFPSEDWIKLVGEEAQRLLLMEAPSPDASFTMIEQYANTPSPRTDGLLDGYRLDFKGREVTVRSGIRPDETADFHVTVDYDVVVKSLKVKAGPEMDALVSDAVQSGGMSFSGDAQNAPIPMMSLHDAMVERSA